MQYSQSKLFLMGFMLYKLDTTDVEDEAKSNSVTFLFQVSAIGEFKLEISLD